jgi:branched-chain amino acid transport system permease protein
MRIFLARPMARVFLAVLITVALALVPLVSSPLINYQFSVIATFAVALLGLNIVMGYAGQVSLGQSAFLGIGAYVTAFGIHAGWPIPLTFLAACILPAVIGALVALAAARLRGLALAMVTLSLPIIGVPLATRLSALTGGAQGTTVNWLNAPSWSGLADDQWRYYVIFAIAAVMFVLARNLVRGRIGRAFSIVKNNESVAIAMGVSPYRYKVLAFTIASLFGGASGFLYLAAVQYTSPATLSFGTSINLVAAMVIGGSASIVGTALGAIYYVVLPIVAGQVDSSKTSLITGAVLLAVLLLLPRGLASLPGRIAELRARGRRPRSIPTSPVPAPAVAADAIPEIPQKST